MKTKFIPIICILLLSLAFVSAVSIKDVSSNPTEVVPGGTVKVTIKIENNLNYDIENVNIKLELSEAPFAPYESSSEAHEDELDEGDDENVLFYLIALPQTASGIYKIPVEISYNYESENETLESTKTGVISLTVNSAPELKVSYENGVLIKGKENEFSIKIVNSGLSDVKFAYVSVGSVIGIEFLDEKEQYVGDIDSDDFDSVKYKCLVGENAVGTISLPVTLKYKDATNKEYTETTSVNIKTYNLKEAQAKGLVKKPNYFPYIIVSVLIIIYFVRRYFKKRKLRKKTLKENNGGN